MKVYLHNDYAQSKCWDQKIRIILKFVKDSYKEKQCVTPKWEVVVYILWPLNFASTWK